MSGGHGDTSRCAKAVACPGSRRGPRLARSLKEGDSLTRGETSQSALKQAATATLQTGYEHQAIPCFYALRPREIGQKQHYHKALC